MDWMYSRKQFSVMEIMTRLWNVSEEKGKCQGTEQSKKKNPHQFIFISFSFLNSVDEILAAKDNLTQSMHKIGEIDYLTRPIIDGDYLPDDPKILLQNGQVNKAEVILGLTANEGSFYVVFFAQKAKAFDEEMFKRCIRPLLMCGRIHKLGEEAVQMEYLGDIHRNDSDGIRQMIVDAVTDMRRLVPAAEEASLLSKAGNPVYLYVMDHEPHAPR